MSLVIDRDNYTIPSGCLEFEASILVLQHPSSLKANFHGTVHIGSIRQGASIVSMNVPEVSAGGKALVRFKFDKLPEYIRPAAKLFLRDGQIKVVGHVVNQLS